MELLGPTLHDSSPNGELTVVCTLWAGVLELQTRFARGCEAHVFDVPNLHASTSHATIVTWLVETWRCGASNT